MRRRRLTFDPNPKELASRAAGGGSSVALLWSRRTGRAAIVVEEVSGEVVELDVGERDNPLELYQHPYAYIRARGHPGRPDPGRLPEAA
jgi:hypothetical protein